MYKTIIIRNQQAILERINRDLVEAYRKGFDTLRDVRTSNLRDGELIIKYPENLNEEVVEYLNRLKESWDS